MVVSTINFFVNTGTEGFGGIRRDPAGILGIRQGSEGFGRDSEGFGRDPRDPGIFEFFFSKRVF